MKRPSFCFLLLMSAYVCIFLFPSYWLFLPASFVIFFLSHNVKKSLFWLGMFNLLVVFWLCFLLLGDEWEKALKIFWTSNLFASFALGLYCDRGAIFITQSLQNILPKKLNMLIFMSARLIDELKEDLERGKQTLQIRLPSSPPFSLTCKTYGYMIGKIICHGLLRAQQLFLSLQIRGYDGGRLGVFEESIKTRDGIALSLLLLSIALGECL